MAKQTFTTGQVLTAAQMTSLQQTAMGGGSTTAKTTSYVLTAADAGTVVQMNAAGATTITVNTALFAAGDTVQIQNIGAGVCTVTAGTATVSTSATLALKQYDAGTLYFNSTGAAIFFAVDAADGMANVLTTTGDIIYSSSGTTAARLGIGTTGQVLTVASGIPAWSAGASFVGVCAIANGTSQSFTSNTFKMVEFSTESIDTDSFHSNSTNNSRLTIPSGKSGYYRMGINIACDGSMGTYFSIYPYKNGTAMGTTEGLRQGIFLNTGTSQQLSGSGIFYFAAADYVEVGALSDFATGSKTTYAQFTLQFLSA